MKDTTPTYTLEFRSNLPNIEARFEAKATNEQDALKIFYADAEDILYDKLDDVRFKEFVDWVHQWSINPTAEQSIKIKKHYPHCPCCK